MKKRVRLFCYLENGQEGRRITIFDHEPTESECEIASDKFANACEESSGSEASSHGWEIL